MEQTQKTAGQWGHAPEREKLASHHSSVLKKCAATAWGHAGVLPCALGLALVILQQGTCSLSPCSSGANLPPEAEKSWSDFTPQIQAPRQFTKTAENTQGVQQTPLLSSAAARLRCSISMKHVESHFYPIPVKLYFGWIFQYMINQQGLSHTSLPLKKQLCCHVPTSHDLNGAYKKATSITA